VVLGNAGLTRHFRQGLERGLRAAMLAHQAKKRAHANAAGTQEAKPGNLVFRTLGWGEGVGGRE